MRFLFILILPILLFGSKILSYNVYERSNRVDIMLTFDTPYEGKLSKTKKSNTIILKLQGASIEAPKIKNLNTAFLHKMTITPINSHTEIILKTAKDVVMQASKTSDSYGLRLRFNKSDVANTSSKPAKPDAVVSDFLPTKKSGELNNSYYIVIAILLVGIIIMLWIKRKMGSPTAKTKQPWLFKNSPKKDGVEVRFQKALDPKNRVVMLDHGDQSYLLVIGNSNVLLDKFIGDEPIRTQSEFERVLDENRAELDSYLQLDSSEVEPLQAYKDKASGKIHELV